MEIIPKEEVAALVDAKKRGEFTDLIDYMEKGSALRIAVSEWRKRTPVPYYFLGKFNRGIKRVSVQRVGDYYYVIRL